MAIKRARHINSVKLENLTWGTFVKNALQPNTPKPVGIKNPRCSKAQKAAAKGNHGHKKAP